MKAQPAGRPLRKRGAGIDVEGAGYVKFVNIIVSQRNRNGASSDHNVNTDLAVGIRAVFHHIGKKFFHRKVYRKPYRFAYLVVRKNRLRKLIDSGE